MKKYLFLPIAMFICCGSFAQNAKAQKNQPIEKKETATLQNNKPSSTEKDKVNSKVIPGVTDGIYKYEEPQKALRKEEKSEAKATDKIVNPK